MLLPPGGRGVLNVQKESIAERALANRYGFARALFERAMDSMRVEMRYLELTPDDALRAPGVSEPPSV
jgi:hypothetical protein